MKNSSNTSLKVNMILNALKGMLGIIFPLITFPYASKILGVENIGKYNFSYAIISYFLLISGLGIKVYVIREGARIRNLKSEIQKLSNEVFSINMISTGIAYFLLIIIIMIVPKLHDYVNLLVILSLQIVFTTIGVEWIYSIYEDYIYITIRSILFNILSLVLLFLFVRDAGDVCWYAGIVVISGIGSNVINYIHSQKYYRIQLTFKVNWKQHIKPIMLLFAMQVATTVFVNSDITILGFLWDDSVVGIYSVSTKVYSIVKTVLASVIIVSVPRISSLLEEDNQKVLNETVKDIYYTLITIAIPAMIGIVMLRKQIVLLIANSNFLSAVTSMSILSIALMFSLGAWFWGQAILVPLKKEAFVFKATVISAIVNIVMNFILIPFWQEKAAAFTTLIAEFIAFLLQRYEGEKYINLEGAGHLIRKVGVGCLAIVVVFVLLSPIESYTVVYTILSIALSVITYCIVEIIAKNEAIFNIYYELKTKFNH